jgi:tRNA threonylcarbamoyladenosine biosynthesis protein TsaE
VTRETAGAAETEQLAAGLAAGLRAGDTVLISGDLGAGKTTFVRGACRALGVTVPVTSPTFTIGQIYPGRDCEVAHLDLYRLGTLADEDPDLLADYIRPDTIAFVEWPQGAEHELELIGTVRQRVTLAHAGGDHRTIEVNEG